MTIVPVSLRCRAAACLFAALSLLAVPAALAEPAAYLNVQADGVAVHGYDPVAYFTIGKPTPGKAEFTATYEGATYRFANAENREMFRKDPSKFAPQYGGWCAYGVAKGAKADGDPNVWKVVDGKLYLNVNPEIGRKWSKDIPGYLQASERQWPKIKDQPAQGR